MIKDENQTTACANCGKDMAMNDNWNLYKLFYYVAGTGSTAAAAKKLFVAQPTVSRGIRELEEYLCCPLFERSYRGMELTEAGRTLYAQVKQAAIAIGRAEDVLRLPGEADTAQARVAVIDTTLQFFVLPRRKAYEQLHPKIHISTRPCTDTAMAEALLEDGTVDLAVMCEPSSREDLESIPVKKMSDVLVCAAAFREMLPEKRLRMEQLGDYPLITHGENTPSRNHIEECLRARGMHIEPKYEFTHVSSIVRQIRTEFALAFILKDTIRRELEAGDLVEIDLYPPLPPRFYYLIRPKTPLPSEVEGLIDYFRQTTEL